MYYSYIENVLISAYNRFRKCISKLIIITYGIVDDYTHIHTHTHTHTHFRIKLTYCLNIYLYLQNKY